MINDLSKRHSSGTLDAPRWPNGDQVRCGGGHPLEPALVQRMRREGRGSCYCSDCGEVVVLGLDWQLDGPPAASVAVTSGTAEALFERALHYVGRQAADRGTGGTSVFISYAWGEARHERWIRDRLVPDLELAGAQLIYDRHENVLVGSHIPAFVDRLATADKIVVVGTPLYVAKSSNEYSESGSILALEKNVIYEQLMRNKTKRKVLPILLEGDKYESIPPALWGLVPADFREEDQYFQSAFKLVLSVFEMTMADPFVAKLHDALQL